MVTLPKLIVEGLSETCPADGSGVEEGAILETAQLVTDIMPIDSRAI
jgi:hypothetical protein